MSYISPRPGGGGGGTVTGAANGLSLSGTNVILGGTLNQNTTVHDSTGGFDLVFSQDQDGGALLSGMKIGSVLSPFGGLDGIELSQVHADYEAFISVIDGTGLGATPATIVFAANEVATGDNSLMFFTFANAGISTSQIGTGWSSSLSSGGEDAQLIAENVGTNDGVFFQADMNGGAPDHRGRIRWQSDTPSRIYDIIINEDGVTFDYGSEQYTLPIISDPGFLYNDGLGNTSWVASGASLTATQIGFGGVTNLLDGEPFFTFDSANRSVMLELDYPVNQPYLTFGATIANPMNIGPNDITVDMASTYESSGYGGNLTITIESATTFGAIFTGSNGEILGSVTGITVVDVGSPYIFNDINGHPIASIHWATVGGRDPGDEWTKSTSLTSSDTGLNIETDTGIAYLKINPVTGSYIFGNTNNVSDEFYGNGNHIQIIDATQDIFIRSNTYVMGQFEGDSATIRFGDLGGGTSIFIVPSSDQFYVTDVASGIIPLAVNTSGSGTVTVGEGNGLFLYQSGATDVIQVKFGSNNYLNIEYNAGEPNVNFGDLDGSGNSTRIMLSDSTNSISLISGGDIIRLDLSGGAALTARMGDSTNVNNGTFVEVDDDDSLIKITNVPDFADDAAAIGGGLVTGQLYKTTAGGSTEVKIVP